MSKNLALTVLETALKTPDAPALLGEAGLVTYDALSSEIRALAGALEALGLAEGDRVGLLMLNQREYVVSFFALLGLGVTAIPLNTRLTAVEIGVILDDAGARMLLASQDFSEVLSGLDVPGLERILLAEEYDALVREGRSPRPPFPRDVTPQTVATLVYTSGTTGRPKGVMLSHDNIRADALANVRVIGATATDRFITISPLFHVFGQTNVLVSAMIAGAAVVLVKKFSPRKVLEAIERFQVTFMAAVPTMYQMMLTHLKENAYDVSSIRVCHSGAAAMPVELIGRIQDAFGAPVQEGYGLSEASSIVCSNPLTGLRKPGSVGPPIPGVAVRVASCEEGENGRVLPAGEIGELQVKGPIVMLGYFNRPDETRKVLLEGGWLRTRDMAFLDEDGYVTIVDRMDDLINIGGVKVYPREIEEVLHRHPAVQAVAVIGEPSNLYHQEIKAFVVPDPGQSRPTGDELYRFCQPCLAEYKIPKTFEFVTEIPQGATGKILRKDLRRI